MLRFTHLREAFEGGEFALGELLAEHVPSVRYLFQEQACQLCQETGGEKEWHGGVTFISHILVLILHQSLIHGMAVHAQLPIERCHLLILKEVSPGLTEGYHLPPVITLPVLPYGLTLLVCLRMSNGITYFIIIPVRVSLKKSYDVPCLKN